MNHISISISSLSHLPDDAALLVVSDDGLGGFVIQIQTLLDGLLVVVGAAAGLSALHQPLHHGLGLRVNVQQQSWSTDLTGRDGHGNMSVFTCSQITLNLWVNLRTERTNNIKQK